MTPLWEVAVRPAALKESGYPFDLPLIRARPALDLSALDRGPGEGAGMALTSRWSMIWRIRRTGDTMSRTRSAPGWSLRVFRHVLALARPTRRWEIVEA